MKESGNTPSNPLGFFDKTNVDNTKEADLALIEDARAREEARMALAVYAAKSGEALERYRQKWITRERGIEERLDAMNPKNPARIAGEHLYARIQDHVHGRLGGMLLKNIEKEKAIVQMARRPRRDRGPDRER